MDPRRKSSTSDTSSKRPTRTTAGRWSLLNEQQAAPDATPIAQARRTDAALESFARMLLARYGVLFRDLLTRESNAPKWRELLGILRRLEARGEVRGGRFVSGFGGEQFALPEAVESLRTARHRESADLISVAAADPLNLVGILIPGERVPAVPGRELRYRNGSRAIEDTQNTGDPPPIEAPVSSIHSTKRHRFLPPLPSAIPAKPTPSAPTLF